VRDRIASKIKRKEEEAEKENKKIYFGWDLGGKL
jgi:hypothetical protein